jgi:SAM-dependent methyltransferase
MMGAPVPREERTMIEQPTLTPAETFDRYFGPVLFQPWAPLLLEHAAPRPGERVLDLACGTGTVSRLVAPLVGPRGRLVGLDLSPAMLAVARARPAPEGAAIEWREGDATATDLPDGAFDLVLCQQGVQFFPNRRAAAREMRRVLTDAGRVALTVWRGLDHHPVYRALIEAEARHLGLPLDDAASPFSFGEAAALHALLDGAGFRQIEIVPRSLTARFPGAERFVSLTLFAATAFLPDFDWEDEAVRSALIEAVSREIAPVVEAHRQGDELVFPMSAHIAVARA